ncbi:hypothetical protein [Flavobacterium lacisediminis]|uniref:Uncharacterized protein n=1 Tax=Flavobacterium lacisediminis TaxID=2989705 RepID=A0ABT3EJW3_9FLAO|nr:hypothetical protein [Flavobacterium lacisediminis]MCW1148868.1 hypothetical protein [Flavobacterium lacisediminis]
MKTKLFVLFFLFQFVSIFAQKDSPFKTSKLKLNWDEPAKVDTESNTTTLPYKSIFDKDDSYLKRYSILNQKKGEESVLLQKNEFKNPGDEIKDKLNKETQQGSWENVFFGKFKVSTPVLKIMTRDHMDPDGDKVRIILNEVTAFNVIYLDSEFKTSYVELREGDNLLDIVALNQGLSGPNTATFAIYDENDNLITTNDWNLNTGVAAKFIIEYVKPMEKK